MQCYFTFHGQIRSSCCKMSDKIACKNTTNNPNMQVLMQKNANLLEIFLVHLSKRIKKDLHNSKIYCIFAPDYEQICPRNSDPADGY